MQGDLPEKKWLLASRHSRSLKVIGADMNRSATYDFMLVIHSRRGPKLFCFLDKRRFWTRIAFLTPFLTSPWRHSLENLLRRRGWKKKL